VVRKNNNAEVIEDTELEEIEDLEEIDLEDDEELEDDEPTLVTPKVLAASLGINPKKLRAWLRQNFTRTRDEHNTSWFLTQEMIDAATARFTPKDDEDLPEDEELELDDDEVLEV
jgi:hypothetical protein